MTLVAWTISCFIEVIIEIWIIRFGGAEWMENTFLAWSRFGILEADTLKLIAWATVTVRIIWFLIGVFIPEARTYRFWAL